jgi:hypothetical protein
MMELKEEKSFEYCLLFIIIGFPMLKFGKRNSEQIAALLHPCQIFLRLYNHFHMAVMYLATKLSILQICVVKSQTQLFYNMLLYNIV